MININFQYLNIFMKKVLIFAVAMAGLFFVGCVKNEEASEMTDGGKTWVKASVAIPETRLSVDMKDLKPAWVFNDNIKLETSDKGWQEFTLKNGQGTQIGLFEGDGTPRVGSVAIYPASNAGAGTYTFPAEYEFRPLNYDAINENGEPISEIPMVGKIRGNDDIKFYHVGGAIAMKFNEITPSEHRLIVTLTGAPVTGTATVDASNPDAALVPSSSTGQEVTVYINKTTKYTLTDQTILVPVPAGTYSKLSFDLQLVDREYDKQGRLISEEWVTVAKKSRTTSITVTKGGIFSFTPCTTNYKNDKIRRAHFPYGGNLDASYTNSTLLISWVNTATDVAYMDSDGSGHTPVALSSKFYQEYKEELDDWYQYVRLNQETVDFGINTLKTHQSGSGDGAHQWVIVQTRGYQDVVRLTCADPSSKTNADGSVNVDYYRYTIEVQSNSGWSTSYIPLAYYMKSDIEILYNAYKKGTIQGSRNDVRSVENAINSMFGGNYTMQNSNQQTMWSKPYFEEVTLPDGTTEYVLLSPAMDNGLFSVSSLTQTLKNSSATIYATVTQADGTTVTKDWPVAEFVHTKFMLLYAEVGE